MVQRGGRDISRAAALAVMFNASQAATATGERPRDETGDTPLTDSGTLTDEPRVSPLELRARSYAQASEFEAQRAREAQMRRSAETFVGAPTFPDIGETPATPAPAPSGTGERRQKTTTQRTEEQDEEGEEVRRVVQYEQAIMQKKQQLARLQQRAAKQAEQEAAEAKRVRREGREKRWGKVNGLNLSTSEDVVGGILAVAMMNAQLINDMTLQNHDLIPKQSISQKAIITFINLGFLTSILPIILPSMIVLMVVVLIMMSVLPDFIELMSW